MIETGGSILFSADLSSATWRCTATVRGNPNPCCRINHFLFIFIEICKVTIKFLLGVNFYMHRILRKKNSEFIYATK